MGLRVLVLDMDPQASISKGFFGPETVERLAPEQTLAMLFDEQFFFADRARLLCETVIDNVLLCPSNSYLHAFNTPSPDALGMEQQALAEFIQSEASTFDLVLIDCPPNLYRCSWTAMVASDFVVIPVPPEDFGTQGLRAVHQAIEEVRQLNPKLRRLGHVITRRDKKLVIHRHIDSQLREYYKGQVFQTVVSELNDFKLAVSARTPIEFYRPKTVAADLMRSLAREILSHICERTTRRHVA